MTSLIQDGVKVWGVKVESAVRIESPDDAKPGVVIARLKTETDKKKVMWHRKAMD